MKNGPDHLEVLFSYIMRDETEFSEGSIEVKWCKHCRTVFQTVTNSHYPWLGSQPGTIFTRSHEPGCKWLRA